MFSALESETAAHISSFDSQFLTFRNCYVENMKSCQEIIPKCEAERLKQLKLKLGASLTFSAVRDPSVGLLDLLCP